MSFRADWEAMPAEWRALGVRWTSPPPGWELSTALRKRKARPEDREEALPEYIPLPADSDDEAEHVGECETPPARAEATESPDFGCAEPPPRRTLRLAFRGWHRAPSART